MAVFISHSFNDKDQFDNIADALEQNGVPYWRPGEMMPGATLSEQLRDAIGRSELCIFVATRHSVDSAWCGAELGAFWGAGKRVLIYVADSSLKDDKLPRQFQGHLLERRISKIVDAVRFYLSEKRPDAPQPEGRALISSAGISKQDMVELIESAIDRANSRASSLAAVHQLSARLQLPVQEDIGEQERNAIRASLHLFLGLSRSAIESAAPQDFPYSVQIVTTSGQWEGFAKEHWERSEDYGYSPCLLLRYDDKLRVIAAALLKEIVDSNLRGMVATGEIAIVGRGTFGERKGAGYV